ncbi:hypothetical protein V6N13_045509 [Hibiscus sabdariffa]|uniref:Uncharacterized protein n=1 Tax=Hibiscus sabdariffa TaxID=183260 RepID=A0ABR2RLN4_9ROSI
MGEWTFCIPFSLLGDGVKQRLKCFHLIITYGWLVPHLPSDEQNSELLLSPWGLAPSISLPFRTNLDGSVVLSASAQRTPTCCQKLASRAQNAAAAGPCCTVLATFYVLSIKSYKVPGP